MSQVYVLTNPAMPGLVKIGRSFDAEFRARQLSEATGVPCAFEVYASQVVHDSAAVEAIAHRELSHKRVNQKREFFAVEPAQALTTLQAAELSDLWRMAGTEARERFLADIDKPVMDQRYA